MLVARLVRADGDSGAVGPVQAPAQVLAAVAARLPPVGEREERLLADLQHGVAAPERVRRRLLADEDQARAQPAAAQLGGRFGEKRARVLRRRNRVGPDEGDAVAFEIRDRAVHRRAEQEPPRRVVVEAERERALAQTGRESKRPSALVRPLLRDAVLLRPRADVRRRLGEPRRVDLGRELLQLRSPPRWDGSLLEIDALERVGDLRVVGGDCLEVGPDLRRSLVGELLQDRRRLLDVLRVRALERRRVLGREVGELPAVRGGGETGEARRGRALPRSCRCLRGGRRLCGGRLVFVVADLWPPPPQPAARITTAARASAIERMRCGSFSQEGRRRPYTAPGSAPIGANYAAARPSARAIAATCSGVEPQQPPTMRAPRPTYPRDVLCEDPRARLVDDLVADDARHAGVRLHPERNSGAAASNSPTTRPCPRGTVRSSRRPRRRRAARPPRRRRPALTPIIVRVP